MKVNFLILLLVISTGMFAQTASNDFDKAVEMYQNASNDLDEYMKNDDMDFFEAEEMLEEIEDELNSSAKLFFEINKLNIAGYQSVTTYYFMLCKEKLARVYNQLFDYESAYSSLSVMKLFIDGTKTIKFPVKFKYKNSNYELLDTHWQSFKKDYFTTLRETTYNLRKYDENVQCINTYLKQNNLDYLEKFTAYEMLIQLKKGGNYTFSTEETVNYLSESLINYYELSQTQKNKIISDSTKIHSYKALSFLETEIKDKILSNQSVSKIAEALHSAALHDSRSEALYNLYEIILNRFFTSNDYSGNQFAYNLKISPRDFLSGVDKIARFSAGYKSSTGNDYLNIGLDVLLKTEKEKAKKVALIASELLVDNAVKNMKCDDIDLAISNFTFWKADLQVKKYSGLAETCRKKAKAEEERVQRKQKMDRLNFNLYGGFYPIGMLTKPENMDVGGVINFVTSEKAYEFSYLKVNKKKENYFDLWIQSIDYDGDDLSVWNGYYTHFQYKKFFKDSPVYMGFLFGYASKDFEPFAANITDLKTNATSVANFDPFTKQYIFMINNGILSLSKGYGYDAFFGIGATYNMFDAGNNIDKLAYRIENATLQNRKSNYFSYMMRVGVTIGFNIGKGNRK